MTFTIFTLNVHKGFGLFNRGFVLHELREAVREVGAEVVLLQEVMGEHTLHKLHVPGWPETSHYEFLAESLWSEFAYGRNSVSPHGHHGNAVLSKFPVVSFRNHDVSPAKGEGRGLLHCVVQRPGEAPVHVVCVHLGLLEAQRQMQVRQLCHLIQTLPSTQPLIIAGDFNDWRLHAHKRLMRCAGVQEVFVQGQGKAVKTFPSRWPVLKLDRIYVRGVGLHQPLPLPKRPWSHLSDHVPLAARITL